MVSMLPLTNLGMSMAGKASLPSSGTLLVPVWLLQPASAGFGYNSTLEKKAINVQKVSAAVVMDRSSIITSLANFEATEMDTMILLQRRQRCIVQRAASADAVRAVSAVSVVYRTGCVW